MAKFPGKVVLADGRSFPIIWNGFSDMAFPKLCVDEVERDRYWDAINAERERWVQPAMEADDTFGILHTSEGRDAYSWSVRLSLRRMIVVGPLSFPDVSDEPTVPGVLLRHPRATEFGLPDISQQSEPEPGL